MPTPRLTFLFVISFALAVVGQATAQEPVELRWKFEQGEAFVTDWKQTLESRVTIEDAQGQTLRQIETKYDLSMRIGWTIASVATDGGAVAAEGGWVTDQKIESLILAVRAPGNVLRQIELPSEQEPPKEFAALSAALRESIDVPIRVTLSSRGEPLSVELPEAWRKLAENEELGPAAQQLSTPEGWQRLLASSTTTLPEKAVAVGDKWRTEDPPLGELPYRMTTEWTLAGVEGEVASLTFASTVEKSVPDAAGDGAGEGKASPGEAPDVANVAVTGFERTGTATIDLADGTLTGFRSETKLNLGKRSGEYVLSTQQSSATIVSTKKLDPQAPTNGEPTPDDSSEEN